MVPKMVEASHYAKKLNNSAALCIEIGEYDRAISSLGKALRLSELYKDNEFVDICPCRRCTIDECISYSESVPSRFVFPDRAPRPPPSSLNNPTTACSPRGTKPGRSRESSGSFLKGHFWKPGDGCGDETTLSSGAFYRRPIHISPELMVEGHNMGSALFLVIVFNLALAHHCALVGMGFGCDEKRHEKLTTTRKLYELADAWYQRHKKRHSNQVRQHTHQYEGDRFEMILCNNSSRIYHLLNDYTKYRYALERLTSALMLTVDHKKSRVEQFHPTNAYQQDQDEHYCDNDRNCSGNDNYHMEEFLRTASQIILRKQCADAA